MGVFIIPEKSEAERNTLLSVELPHITATVSHTKFLAGALSPRAASFGWLSECCYNAPNDSLNSDLNSDKILLIPEVSGIMQE